MFWEEEEDKNLPYKIPEDVIDLSFSIACKSLPLNHAWELSSQILSHLPWIKNDPVAGIHQIHVAESNNGWLRPEDTDGALLHPSRRTKLTLRIPIEKLGEAQSLSGKILNINNYSLEVLKSKKKALSNASVIFSRYLLSNSSEEDETQFLTRMAKDIKDKTDLTVKKMLCGKSHIIRTPQGDLETRHLMIADLDSATSIKLQQLGLGKGKELGCGLFLPHKGIRSLNSTD